MGLYFKSDYHEELMYKYLEKFGLDSVTQDREYGALCYLFSASHKDEMLKYCSPEGIETQKILDEIGVFSSSEKAMIKLGLHLFNSGILDITFDGVFYSLDSYNYKVVMSALELRYNR